MTTNLGESRLSALLESAKLLNSSLELDDLLRHLLRTVMGRTLASRGALAVESEGQLRVRLVRGCPTLPAGSILSEESGRAAGLESFYTIGEPDQPLGLLGLSASIRGALDPEEEEFVRALLGLASSGINNARAHEAAVLSARSLDQKVQELRALLDLVRGLAATLEPEEIAQLLMLTLAGRWIVRRHGMIAWRDGQPTLLRQKGLTLTTLAECQEAITALPDAVVSTAETSLPLVGCGIPEGSLLLPIRNGQSTFGIVVCGPRMGNQNYTEADREFGAGLVAQAAVALDNAWHFRETIGKKQMEKELLLAANIQQDLFPSQLPKLSHTQLAARNRQARQVGGDYYDAIALDGPAPSSPRLLCVVDISGKGLFASLLMSNIQATLRALLSQDNRLPVLAARANDLLHATTPANRYATALLMCYDPASGECRWVNCGHNDGIVLRANHEVEMLPCGGLALGLFPRQTHEEQTFIAQEGDIVALYSDGVTEAQSEAGEEWGNDRLIACLRRHSSKNAHELVDAVIAELDEFVGTAPQFDDITLMILKRVQDPAA